MKTILRKIGLLGLGLAVSLAVMADTFTQFTPATGVLVGDSTTPVTTAATSANIRSLWGGTCNTTTFLRGDGNCNQVSLTTNVTGTLPVANGGTNLTASADDSTMVGNGTTWVSTAIPNCVDTTGNHLNYTTATNLFSCGTSGPGGITGLANPTGTIGLTAVNGVATTAMRSDGAPPLSQGIAPTWTAQHIFTLSGAARANAAVKLVADTPFFRITETDQAADSQDWGIGPSAGNLRLGSMADADTSILNAGQALSLTRTGASITSVSLGNTSSNPTFAFLGTGVATFTGQIVSSVTGSSLTSGIYVNTAGAASVGLNNSSNAANNRLWDITAGTTSMSLRAIDDANTTPKVWASASRSGASITGITLGNSTDTILAALNSLSSTTLTIQNAGTRRGYVGVASATNGVCTGTATNDMCIAVTGGATIRASTDDGTTSNPLAIVTSGSFTASFDAACTTTPTAVFIWQKMGNQVTLQMISNSGFPCTGDTTSFQATSTSTTPATIRPATSAKSAVMVDASDNGAATSSVTQVNPTGELQFNRVSTAGATAVWTAAGSRNPPGINQSFTYLTNN